MTTPNDGGPVFPRGPFYYGPDGRILHMQKDQSEPGMSLRDWFAGLAMQGFFYNPEWRGLPSDQLAAWAYQQADVMLKARDNKPAPDGC